MLEACPAALPAEPAATDVALAVLGWLEDALFLGGAVGGAEDVGGGWFPAVDLEAAAEGAAVAGPDTAAAACDILSVGNLRVDKMSQTLQVLVVQFNVVMTSSL